DQKGSYRDRGEEPDPTLRQHREKEKAAQVKERCQQLRTARDVRDGFGLHRMNEKERRSKRRISARNRWIFDNLPEDSGGNCKYEQPVQQVQHQIDDVIAEYLLPTKPVIECKARVGKGADP